ncbi:hypothetical protein K2173_007419 [Erythroxylum novogranatense]|uniref:Uncharacterized protein n=1 Tax=Erythroxylum novogranatense TaxID=1862640 RepID=A0AAV8T7V6_9ROSI|nr:hypothetical protein K2173_007419 [Erythroxylum novogranatense]
MVGARVFIRSLSFPNRLSKPPLITHHFRSVSLPCRSHPLIVQLRHEINDLKTWVSMPQDMTSVWISDGLKRLRDVNESLGYIIQLPQTQESLRNHRKWVDKLLDDFLRFIDVYGIFQNMVLGFKVEVLAAQVAVRKRDDSGIESYDKTRKKMAKQVAKLVARVRSTAHDSSVPRLSSVPVSDKELVCLFSDVSEVTVLVSVALFRGILTSLSPKKFPCMELRRIGKKTKKVEVERGIEEFEKCRVKNLWDLRKKEDDEIKMVLGKMQELEWCIGDLEAGGERLFRSFINTRVLLLNTLIQ